MTLAACAGVFFRFHNIDRKVYWNDEVWTSIWISGHSGADVLSTVPAQRVIAPEDLMVYQRVRPGHGVGASIAALTAEDPKQPALYLLMVRTWAGLFGDEPGPVRLLSALISLLVLPVAYWFGREVFGDRISALVLVTLIAVSPFHILYSQEARPYSLWALFTLASGAALLAALARPSPARWSLYAVNVAGGLYSHTLFGLVLMGQVVYVLLASRERRSYFLALAGGIAAFLPWAWFIVKRIGVLKGNTEWVAEVTGYPALMSRLVLAFTAPFVDTGLVHGARFWSTPGGLLAATMVLPFLVILVIALLSMKRSAPASITCFVLCLAGPTALVLLLPDLILGGSGITTARFLLPVLLAFGIAVAWFVGQFLNDTEPARRRAGVILLMVLVAGGFISAFRWSQADTWWNKYLNRNAPELAAAIHASERPLLLADDSGVDFWRILALSRRLEPKVALFLVRDPAGLVIPEGYSDIFWFAGRSEVRMEMERRGLRFRQEIPNAGLWRLDSDITGQNAGR
jgi:uncharacterized membrane protein